MLLCTSVEVSPSSTITSALNGHSEVVVLTLLSKRRKRGREGEEGDGELQEQPLRLSHWQVRIQYTRDSLPRGNCAATASMGWLLGESSLENCKEMKGRVGE